MTTLLSLDIILSAKDYCKIITNIFQIYATKYFENKLFLRSIKIDFKY